MPTKLTPADADAQIAELRALVEEYARQVEAVLRALAAIGTAAGRPDITAMATVRPDLKIV